MSIFSPKTFFLAAVLCLIINIHAETVVKIWDISLKQPDIDLSEWQLKGNARVTPEGIITESGSENSEAVLLRDILIPGLADGKLLRIEWEYTPLRIGKYGQDFRIENGPLVMEVMSRRPFLNVSARALFDKTNNRRYRVTCDFFKDYIISWKINGMEQLSEPIPAWKHSGDQAPRITLSDFPDSVSRTLWHRITLYEIKDIDTLKIALLCLNQTQRIQQPEFFVGINTPMDKIPLDSLKYKGTFNDTVEIAAAGRECVSFQLALIPRTGTLENVTVTISDFLSKDGKRLPSDIARCHIVGFVKLDDSRITESRYGEYWPDAIMPMRPLTVTAGLTQPYWFNVSVPPGTAPGIYESIVTVKSSNGGERSLKLKLQVRNFDLPLRNTIVTALAINPGAIERCYNSALSRQLFGRSDAAAHNRMYNLSAGGALEGADFWRPFYDMLLSYRINPASIYSDVLAGGGEFRVVPAMEDMDYCYERGLNAACLMCLRSLPEDPAERAAYFDKIKTHLTRWENFAKSRNWPGFVWYIHAFDESEIHADTPEKREKSDRDIRLVTAFIRENFPWIKIETANPYIERNAGCFDIWTPKPFRMDEYIQTDANFWMYVCCGPQKPYANLFIDYPGTDPRVIPWQLFLSKTRISGFLYYLMNREIYPDQWAKVNLPFPFVPVKTRWLGTNGDGLLVYPGPDKEIYPSIRLAAFRDGLQDYEAMTMLRNLIGELQKLPESAKHSELIRQALDLLENTPIRSWTVYSSNPQDYINHRARIDLMIEKILTLPEISTGK